MRARPILGVRGLTYDNNDALTDYVKYMINKMRGYVFI